MRHALRLIALLALLLPATVASANETIERAQQLTAASRSASDTLVGNSGGAHRYFAIAYPGGSVPVAVTVRAERHHGTGIKVYGPAGHYGDGIADAAGGWALTISHALPGTYHVQVHNYVQGLPLPFTITVSGLPAAQGQPAAAAAGPPSSTPDRPTATHGTSMTTGGQLVGNSGGAFAFYDLDYPGGQLKLEITLGYSPATYDSREAVGFNLYRANGEQVARGTENGRDASSATVGLTWQADASERFLLQVYNYLPGTTINFTLIVNGLTGSIEPLGDVSSPERAFVLSGASPRAEGTLTGDRSGRFAFLTLRYPGGDREVRVTMTMEPNANIGDGELGFNVFRGAEQVGQAKAGLSDNRGRRTATMFVKQAEAQDFGIQVYNYSGGGTARIRIITSGW